MLLNEVDTESATNTSYDSVQQIRSIDAEELHNSRLSKTHRMRFRHVPGVMGIQQ